MPGLYGGHSFRAIERRLRIVLKLDKSTRDLTGLPSHAGTLVARRSRPGVRPRRALTLLGGLGDGELGTLAPAAGEGEAPAVRGDQAADLGRAPGAGRVRLRR